MKQSVGCSSRTIIRFAQILLEKYMEKLAGHFVVVADKKVRFIELEA